MKYQLLEMPVGERRAAGIVERVGEPVSSCRHEDANGVQTSEPKVADHGEALDLIIELLDGEASAIDAVGHRVVHGGESFSAPVVITDEVMAAIEAHAPLAPLHNSPNLAGIRAAARSLPGVPQVACFDTAFHATLPERAYLYGLPYEIYEHHRVRRYGFHGTSHEYVARRGAEWLGLDLQEFNAITFHLGNGCSVTAVEDGHSVDTSMGFTPLEGLVMGTRSGDLDPAILRYLAGRGVGALDDLDTLLNQRSGLLGLSGVSNDARVLLTEAGRGDRWAALALEVFAYRAKKYLGAYWAILPDVDAVIFTGGIGENAPEIRAMILEGLDESLGVGFDPAANQQAVGTEAEISAAGASTRLLVIPTDEERMIAEHTFRLVGR